uniref:E3 ubiquitin-protein ligase UBR5 n=1 Tax=Panagrellus redivivus TaxID=6233 RepID=A0A7E4ZTP8_PANRE
MSFISPDIVNAVKKILREAAPDDPLPEAVNRALLPLAPQFEPKPSVWAKRQYFAVLRHIALMECPPGALDDEHFFAQTKQCFVQLGTMFARGDGTFPTPDHDENVDLCLKVYNMGKYICNLAERRLGITHLRKKQDEFAKKHNSRQEHDDTHSEATGSSSSDDFKIEVKQEIHEPMPVLEPQVGIECSPILEEIGGYISEPDSESYNMFSIELDPETKALQLIVNVDPNRAYKYKLTDELNMYACINCPAQARIVAAPDHIGSQIVQTTPHNCDPVLYNANAPILNPSDAYHLASVFVAGSESAIGPVRRRRGMKRPFNIECTEFFFGLSSRNNPTKVFTRSPDTDGYHEYNHIAQNLFACVRCRQIGLSTTVKVKSNMLIGQAHHSACFPISEVVIRPIQELRRITAHMTYEEVQQRARNRLIRYI